VFLLLSVVVYLLPCLVTLFYDRYLVFVVPLLAASIASVSLSPSGGGGRAARVVSRLAALVFLAAIGLYSVLGTRDYLAWNRARWQALRELIGSGTAKAEEVDGGYEFNGYVLYDVLYQESPGKSWWWVKGDKYQIAFGDVPGYTTIKEYSYNRWMPPQVGKVVVLQRDVQCPANECVDPPSTGGTSGQSPE